MNLDPDKMVLNFEYKGRVRSIFPAHPFAKHMLFRDGEEVEATLANACAVLAEKNGLSRNDFQHMFPLLLRMFKSQSEWTQ